jgi:MFS family permease
VLVGFKAWQGRRAEQGRDPLVHFRLLDIVPVRAGLVALFLQNLILMGVFFVFPLYLQIVQGLNAFDTGLRMLPISVTLVLAALIGSRLASRVAPRAIVRIGFLVLAGACVFLVGAIETDINSPEFGIGSAFLGIGLGLVASQLGNVLQSSVENADRSEAGALQNTAQQLGSSLGTAFIGAIVITALGIGLVNTVNDDERISGQVQEDLGIAVGGGITFMSADEVRQLATDAGVSEDETNAIVENYEDAQLQSLKLGLLVAAALGLLAIPLCNGLPAKPLEEPEEEEEEPGAVPVPA